MGIDRLCTIRDGYVRPATRRTETAGETGTTERKNKMKTRMDRQKKVHVLYDVTSQSWVSVIQSILGYTAV
jgi:hypothetical protein